MEIVNYLTNTSFPETLTLTTDKLFWNKLHQGTLVPNSQSRPADVYVANWIDGRKMAFDVSVVSPTQDAVLHQAADSAAAINMRKSSKNRAHFENCRLQGIVFQPLVVETFGGWDRDAAQFLKDIARLDARRWGKNDALEIKQFFPKTFNNLAARKRRTTHQS